MKIQIKNRWDQSVIVETDAESVGAAIVAAIQSKTNLRSADLSSADLRRANLNGADLRGADLRSANLNGADLRGANLRSADLRRANLNGADLRGANLRGKDLERLISQKTILADGDLIGWKKLRDGVVCKLLIPKEAKRVGGIIGRKCRAEFATVLAGSGTSKHDSNFKYTVGRIVRSHEFDPNPLEECAGGIHFFITRAEAEEYE